MIQKRIFTIVASLFLLALLIYGVTDISVSQEVKNKSAWSVRCDKDKDGKKTYCEMFSAVSVKDTGVLVAEFAVGYPPNAKGAARGVITLPLGMMLEPGGALQVDDHDAYSFRMRSCSPKGCYAFLDLKDSVLAELKAGKKVSVNFVLGDKKLSIGIPLNGFSDTFKGLK